MAAQKWLDNRKGFVMTLLKRQLICERLRLGLRSSYRVVPPSRLSLISSDEVLEVLNRARRGGMKPLRDIPSDCVAVGNPCRVIKRVNNKRNEGNHQQ